MTLDGQRLRVHHFADQRLARRQDQLAQRHHAQQPPLVIDDVDVIDRLAVGCLQPQAIQRLLDGDVGRQPGVIGGHQRAGGVLRIRDQRGDVAAVGLIDQTQQALDDLRLQTAQQIGAIVVRHLLDQPGHVRPARALDQLLLPFQRKIHENRRLIGDGRRIEKPPHVLDLEGSSASDSATVAGCSVSQNASIAAVSFFSSSRRASGVNSGCGMVGSLSFESVSRSRSKRLYAPLTARCAATDSAIWISRLSIKRVPPNLTARASRTGRLGSELDQSLQRVGVHDGGIIEHGRRHQSDSLHSSPARTDGGIALSRLDPPPRGRQGAIQDRGVPALLRFKILIPRTESQTIRFADDRTDTHLDRHVQIAHHLLNDRAPAGRLFGQKMPGRAGPDGTA